MNQRERDRTDEEGGENEGSASSLDESEQQRRLVEGRARVWRQALLGVV